jgi:hypothetical protein
VVSDGEEEKKETVVAPKREPDQPKAVKSMFKNKIHELPLPKKAPQVESHSAALESLANVREFVHKYDSSDIPKGMLFFPQDFGMV